MTVNKILIVDDEPTILDIYKFALSDEFETDTAESGEEGLALVSERGPYAVVVSDMQMPGMNGVEFLAKVQRTSRDTVRMMLTGNADQSTAAHAINEGSIFRFISKPASPQMLCKALRAGLEQHRLITAEKNLLSRTLAGGIGVLNEVLSLVKPDFYGRSATVRDLVKRICDELQPEDRWEIELAASLAHLGYIGIADDLIAAILSGVSVTRHELEQFQQHAEIGSKLIKRIPRLDGVGKLVAYQHRGFDGSGIPVDGPVGEAIPFGSRILKLVHDFDIACQHCRCPLDAMERIRSRRHEYDPLLLPILEEVVTAGYRKTELGLHELRPGMILDEAVVTVDGDVLLARDLQLNDVMIARLVSYCRIREIREPIAVRIHTNPGVLSV